MKLFFKTLLACGLFFPVAINAQQVKEEVIKVGRHKKDGFVATSDKYSKGQVKDILAAKFETAGLKMSGKKKKFYSFKSVIWPVSGHDKVDIYYRVVTRKHQTKIYFIASKGVNDFITSATDWNAATGIRHFLQQLEPSIALNEEVARKGQSVKDTNADSNKQQVGLQKTGNNINNRAAQISSQPNKMQIVK